MCKIKYEWFERLDWIRRVVVVEQNECVCVVHSDVQKSFIVLHVW